MAFSAQLAARAPVFSSHAPAAPAAPAGTFAPGTKILVGSHKVIIQKYLAEGGFAHVYLVKMPEPKNGTDIGVLKRVAVPDKEQLANMRTEVETMKKLKGHRAIVTYYDSHASQLQGGGYEVFLLMEFCNGGGLIDFMNTRLQNRLTEPEIAKIFADVAEGVACMHYLNPPLLHRDLKVENVLINETSAGKRYKVCDFGSAAHPRKAGKTAEECRQILDDVMRHTTQQYRSPEMVDPHNGQDIDEKSDIWALGVFLYKLCYFTTPFEEQGQLAILNASYKYPAHPAYSDRMKKLIASMLQVDPRRRPNVYQVLTEACSMLGVKIPIKDIYSHPEQRRGQTIASPPVIANSPPVVGVVFSPPKQEAPVIPEITRMARGRPPTAARTPVPLHHKPSPSPMRIVSSDPFAALDSKSTAAAHEEASNRFPSLDQFSLLHEQGSKFEFQDSSPVTGKPPANDLSKRVTERLADDFFGKAAPQPPTASASPFSPGTNAMSRAQRIISGTPELQATISQQQPTEAIRPASPVKPSKPSSYVSHATMTSPDMSVADIQAQRQQYVPPPIHRFPPADDQSRSNSLSRGLATATTPNKSLLSDSPRPQSVSRNRSFQLSSNARESQSPRSSLDSRRPSPLPQAQAELRQRPSSAYLDPAKEKKHGFFSKALPKPRISIDNVVPYTDDISRTPSPASSDSPIESNVEFLRQMEESEKKDSGSKRNSIHKHTKRASLPIRFAEKFGETFKRFESNNAHPSRTPSPLQDGDGRQLGLMTPIAGSEATDDRSDDGRSAELSPDTMTGEQRREQERRTLEEEERRVETAAREYKSRLAEREASGANGRMGPPPTPSLRGVSRASTIQNKVKSLLAENERPTEVQRTAQGYGKYTDVVGEQTRAFESSDRSDSERERGSSIHSQSGRPAFAKPPAPLASRKPVVITQQQQFQQPQQQQQFQQGLGKPKAPPGAKPKPVHLTGGGGGLAPSNPYANASPRSSSTALSSSPPRQSMQSISGTPAVASRPSVGGAEMTGPRDGWSAKEKEDYLHTFKQRYPSLSGIEMVETIVGGGGEERRPPTGRGGSKEMSRVV